MMTLDEAIEHCREKSRGCSACADEHYQLLEWLEELKAYRKSTESNDGIEELLEGLSELKCYQLGLMHGVHSFVNVRPVPLTKEILEKQKFDPMDCSWWENTEFENDCKDEYLWWHIVVTGKTLVVQGEIRYVHELQMALKLCGLEHEFKL